MHSSMLLLSTLAALSAAKTIEVQVGPSGTLKFDPESVTAEKGDKIHFNINEGHNVAQSTFSSPCQPSGDDAIFSADERSFTVTVQSTDPLWMYCAVDSHCQRGMVFAVNPTKDKTVEQYAAAAAKASSNKAPSKENDGSSSSGGSSGSSGSASGTGTASSSGGSSMTSGGSSMASGTMMSSSGSSGASATGSGSSGGSSSSPSPTSSGNAANAIAQPGMGVEYVLVGLTGLLGAIGLL